MNREKIKEQLSEHFSAWEELTERTRRLVGK